jgi:photoactive yellow protein
MRFDRLLAVADVVSQEHLQPDSVGPTGERVLIDSLSPAELDLLPFGVIQLDQEGKIVQYHDYESRLAGIAKSTAIGKNFFTELAPCTDVQEFHGRFKEGASRRQLYETFRYHFAFKRNPRDVSVTLFYSKITESTWVFIRPA